MRVMRTLVRTACALILTLVVTVGALADTRAGQPAGAERLWGTWRLVTFTSGDSGAMVNVFGESPKGFLTYGKDGRMQAIIVHSGRKRPADLTKVADEQRVMLFKTVVAYGGTYTYTGKTVTHHVDISHNESWTGTDQIRNVTWNGDKLVLSTEPAPGANDGKMVSVVLTWEKVPTPP